MDKKLTGLIILFVLIFTLFISYIVFNKQLIVMTRASEELEPSSETSLVFAWPLQAKANNEEKVEINVFVRNSKNVPLANKSVNLITNLGTVNPSIQKTDKLGKASFFLTSDSPGLAEIKSFVNNQIQIKQTVSVKFE